MELSLRLRIYWYPLGSSEVVIDKSGCSLNVAAAFGVLIPDNKIVAANLTVYTKGETTLKEVATGDQLQRGVIERYDDGALYRAKKRTECDKRDGGGC